MPTKPDGNEPKITKGLALEPSLWEEITEVSKKQKLSRNRFLEKIIKEYLKGEK